MCSQTDIKSGEGLQEAFAKVGPIDAVINCAAMSSPAACEKDAATARWVCGVACGTSAKSDVNDMHPFTTKHCWNMEHGTGQCYVCIVVLMFFI